MTIFNPYNLNDFVKKALKESFSFDIEFLQLGFKEWKNEYSHSYIYWAEINVSGINAFVSCHFDSNESQEFNKIYNGFLTQIEEINRALDNHNDHLLYLPILKSLEAKHRYFLETVDLYTGSGPVDLQAIHKFIRKLYFSDKKYSNVEVFNLCINEPSMIIKKFRKEVLKRQKT